MSLSGGYNDTDYLYTWLEGFEIGEAKIDSTERRNEQVHSYSRRFHCLLRIINRIITQAASHHGHTRLNSTTTQVNLIDIYPAVHLPTAENTLFSSADETFARETTFWNRKQFPRAEGFKSHSIFFDHNGIQLKWQKGSWKNPPNVWKL